MKKEETQRSTKRSAWRTTRRCADTLMDERFSVVSSCKGFLRYETYAGLNPKRGAEHFTQRLSELHPRIVPELIGRTIARWPW